MPLVVESDMGEVLQFANKLNLPSTGVKLKIDAILFLHPMQNLSNQKLFEINSSTS